MHFIIDICSQSKKGIYCSFLLILALGIFSGCTTVGPDYKPPQLDISSEWQEISDPALLPQEKLIKKWWTLFNDPLLCDLIETAAQNNLDLLSAIARIQEARSRLNIRSEDRFPDLDATGSIAHQQTSENSIGSGYEETLLSSGIGASWEIDLFGRVRRSIESAAAEFQASQEDTTDVMISIYAYVSLTYIEIRTNQARLSAATSNIESQKEILELTQSRFRHGLATDLDVAQAERLLARAQAEVPSLRIALSQGINNLAVLLGQKPGALHSTLMTVKPIPLPPEHATVGVPADLLRQRPDIRSAERKLAAQTARIGMLTADLYPSFSLNGFFGYESVDIGDLFDPASQVFSFGPSLRWKIFSRNRIRNEIKAQDAVATQYALAYEQTVLNALREVENTLKAYVEDRVRLAALGRSVAAAHRSVKLATDLYKKGLVDFQPVLDAKRDQFDFENQLAVAQGHSAANFIRLYAALGGGWDPNEAVSANN